MARTVLQMKYSDFQETNQMISTILTGHHYKNINQNNENVWKCGIGFWTAMKYVKVEFAEGNTVILSGWIRPMLGSEQDLGGMIAAIPKKQVKNVLEEIQRHMR